MTSFLAKVAQMFVNFWAILKTVTVAFTVVCFTQNTSLFYYF